MAGDESVSPEQELRELAEQLRELSTFTAGKDHADSINGFAAEAEKYANLLRDAVTPELAAAVAAKVDAKKTRWTELRDMMLLAAHMEDEAEALRQAEEELRACATQLSTVAGNGASPVFSAIREIAQQAQTGLDDFLAAETNEEKWQVYTRVKESRARWTARMENMQNSLADGSESQAPTEAPDPSDPACEYVEDAAACRAVLSSQVFSAGECTPWSSGNGCMPMSSTGAAFCTTWGTQATATCSTLSPAPCAGGLASPPEMGSNLTPKEVREQFSAYLNDEETGLLTVLRNAVTKVKDDERFAGVHEDAAKLLEQMELAAGAVAKDPSQDSADNLTAAEDNLRATVETMREAQFGGLNAKKAAFSVQKYDIYKRKGDMPRLASEHSELLQCAKACVEAAEYLRKEAQGAVLDSVTGLVAQTTA